MNKEVFEKNVQAFVKRYNRQYPAIVNNDYEEKIEKTKSGDYTIQLEKDNKKIYLHSKFNPVKEAEKYYENFNPRYGTIVLCIGFGFGYYIREIVNKVSKVDTVTIYEPDYKIFDLAMKYVDISDIIERTNVGIGFMENPILLGIPIDRILQIMPAYDKLFKKECIKFMKNLKNLMINENMELNTRQAFLKEWPKSNFSNIDFILDSYNLSDLNNMFKDKPVVVVSAGPSLDKNIHLLKEIEGRVCIICCFSAAKALQKIGVKPNFLVTLDSKQYGISDYESNIPLIYLKVANEELLRTHNSQKIIALEQGDIYLLKVLEYEGVLSKMYVSGTVASLGFSVALIFGASEIILIGQDFSWSKERAHATGTVHKTEEIKYKAYHNFNMEKKDIYGNTVYTNLPFYSFKEVFDNILKVIPKNIKVIQATEGGLPIEGAKTMTFRKAIDKYCKKRFCHVDKVINKRFNKEKLLGQTFDRDKVYENIKFIYEELKDTKYLMDEAVEINSQIINNLENNSENLSLNDELLNKLDKIDFLLRNSMAKILMDSHSNDITTYHNCEKTGDEKMESAVMSQKFYFEASRALSQIINDAKESMGYED